MLHAHVQAFRAATARRRGTQLTQDHVPTARFRLASNAEHAEAWAAALQALIKPELRGVATALDVLRRTDPAADAAWKEREHARRVWDDLVIDQGWSTGAYRAHLTDLLESALLNPRD